MLLSTGQMSLCSPGLLIALRWRRDPKGHKGKQRTIYTFQDGPFPKSLEPMTHVFPALPQDPYIQSWQLLPLPGKHLPVAMVAVVIGNVGVGVGIVGIGTSKRVGAWILREILQEDR